VGRYAADAGAGDAKIITPGAGPRDRNSPLFDNFKRRVLTALDRSLDRGVPDTDAKSTAGEAMWW
jgi:sulfonate transport system ATP-binding protein